MKQREAAAVSKAVRRQARRFDLCFACALLLYLAASGTALRRTGVLPGSSAVPVATLEEAEGTAQAEPSPMVLVIDPGHGGLDGGATAEDGARESLINLQIGRRMGDLAELLGLSWCMTRTEENLDYPEELDSVHAKKVWDQNHRVELINATPGAVLCSIHQNRYPDPRPSGSQVFYAKTEGSEALASLVHDNLIAVLCPENRRVAAPVSDSIYLMKRVQCPAILVECGFLSNAAEAKKLESEAYQQVLAAVLVGSYMQYMRNSTG